MTGFAQRALLLPNSPYRKEFVVAGRSRGKPQTHKFGFLLRSPRREAPTQDLNSENSQLSLRKKRTPMPLAFTSAPATVGEASRPLAAPFWAGAPRTPTKSDADADADYIGGAGRSPSSLSPIPEETSGGKPTPAERRHLSPTYEAGTPPPEGMGPRRKTGSRNY